MSDVQLGLTQLLADYAALLPKLEKSTKNKQGKGIKLPAREHIERLTVTRSIVLTAHADVVQVIESFKPNSGWICSQSSVNWFGSSGFSEELLCGAILNAELASEGGSLHINQHENGWRLVHLTEEGSSPPFDGIWKPSAVDEPVLAENQKFISTDSTPEEKLWVVYRVFYGQRENGLKTIASRFNKIEGQAI